MRRVAGIVVVLAAVLAGCGGEEGFEAESANMSPTIKVGDEFDIDRDAYRDARPQIGEIVVFRPPSGAEDGTCGDSAQSADQICEKPSEGFSDETFVDRVVALPGDRVSLRGGRLVRNGRPETASYAEPCPEASRCDLPRQAVIPAGHYLLLGDNRGASDDSRFWGPVPEAAMIGRVERTEGEN